MIEITCDNCERTFGVDPDEAGEKVSCPTCGDVNRVPGRGAVPAAPAARPASAADAPATAAGQEKQILVVRPGMFRAHPFRYLTLVLLFLAGVGGAIAAFATAGVAVWVVWPALLLSIVALIWFGYWWMSTHWWVKLVITNKRTVRHEGIVKRHTTEVLHNHVRSVDIQQKFLERIFRIGSIGIDSAGQDQIEIEIHDIPDPYEVKQIIDRYRKM